MTSSRRAGIENTLYLYAWAFDMDEIPRLGECFTARAAVDFPDGPRVGRDAIVVELGARRRRYAPNAERPWHVISNVLIEDVDRAVRARSFFTTSVSRRGDDVPVPRAVGYYDDVFVLDSGRWRIDRRRVVSAGTL
jgi:hypothetical protein